MEPTRWILKPLILPMPYLDNAGHQGICLFDRIQVYLVVNWPRKWAIFDLKKIKISKNVLQKSITFKNHFHFVGRVSKIWRPRQSFCTLNFLLGASRTGFNLMMALDHQLIFIDHEHNKVWHTYLLRFSITPCRFARRG